MPEASAAAKAEGRAVPVSSRLSQGVMPSHSNARVLDCCEHSANLNSTDTWATSCFTSVPGVGICMGTYRKIGEEVG